MEHGTMLLFYHGSYALQLYGTYLVYMPGL